MTRSRHKYAVERHRRSSPYGILRQPAPVGKNIREVVGWGLAILGGRRGGRPRTLGRTRGRYGEDTESARRRFPKGGHTGDRESWAWWGQPGNERNGNRGPKGTLVFSSRDTPSRSSSGGALRRGSIEEEPEDMIDVTPQPVRPVREVLAALEATAESEL